MWTWMKYLYLAIRLGTLWENLKAVRASDPAVSSESYQPASAAILEDPGVQRWLLQLPGAYLLAHPLHITQRRLPAGSVATDDPRSRPGFPDSIARTARSFSAAICS